MTNIKLLTIKEASKLIEGLTEYRIRTLCLNGELPHIKAGKKFLVNEQVLYKYVNGELYVPPAKSSDPKVSIKRVDL